MKVLFSDLLYQEGNRHVDTKMIELMAKKHKVFLLGPKDFLCEEIHSDNLTVINNKKNKNSDNAIGYKLQEIYRMFQTAYYAKKYDVDLIYISVYETRVFPLGFYFFGKKRKVVVVENDNIDLLCNPVHSFCYQLFAKKVNHIVYEEYMKDYLVQSYDIPASKIFSVPHIFYPKEHKHANNTVNSAECVAISLSNDENAIEKLIEIEKKYHRLENAKIKMVVKSKKYTYDNDYLKVSNKFFETDEYDAMFEKCNVVLIPFPDTYKYRMSGNIVDAFSYHKPIIASNIELAIYYKKKYGDIVTIFNTVEEMIELVVKLCSISQKKYDFSCFEEEHSEKSVFDAIDNCLRNIFVQ